MSVLMAAIMIHWPELGQFIAYSRGVSAEQLRYVTQAPSLRRVRQRYFQGNISGIVRHSSAFILKLTNGGYFHGRRKNTRRDAARCRQRRPRRVTACRRRHIRFNEP